MARVVAGLAAVSATVGVVFLLGMRANAPAVVDRVRRFNRAFTNPRVLRTAGAPSASASLIRHVGRSTGRSYETPIGAIPTDDGFVVALPYGSRADWLKNVLAGGSATIVHEGTTYRVDAPVVVRTADLASQLPAGEAALLRLFNVDQCLRLRRTPEHVDSA
ncbi:MAG: nitroreductase family deazaflavin-dependent oxidoreductase [Acidimicrobiales bacterium]